MEQHGGNEGKTVRQENAGITSDQPQRVLPQHWNVIYTAPRAEKRVYERLKELGVHCYLPLYTTLRQWSDRKKKVIVPLFNSYIFVKVAEGEHRSILEVYGVSRFLYYLGKPAVVRQKEIDAIRRFLRQTEGYNIRVQRGDNVEISGGPMEGIYGEVIRIGKQKLVLQILQLGMSIVAEVDRGMVRKPLKKRT
ncbi:MAG: UpxY family transcription antiterminator [Bacteroidales bacterium]